MSRSECEKGYRRWISPSNKSRSITSSPTVDEMISDLLAGGWKRWKGKHTIWQSPVGLIWRGPALAWHVMKGLPFPPNVIDKEKARS